MADQPDYTVLRSFGLSKAAVICYEDLFKQGGTSVPLLAERLDRPRTGLYRVLRQLEARGFVTSTKTPRIPTYFHAVPIDKALRDYSDYQWRLVSDLFEEQRQTLTKRSGRPDHYRGQATF